MDFGERVFREEQRKIRREKARLREAAELELRRKQAALKRRKEWLARNGYGKTRNHDAAPSTLTQATVRDVLAMERAFREAVAE